MTRLDNNIPPFAEEVKINSEAEQIQEILNKFKQPIPNNFIQIETEYLCSTKLNWKGKPLSERYGFDYEGEWKQIDIPHTLMESLELEKGKDIPHFLYLAPNVLNRSETYKGITIESEEEIFLEKSFTANNLDKELTKLFEKIEKLEEEKELKQEIVKGLKQEIEEIKGLKNIWRNKFLEEKESNGREFQTQINELAQERDDIQQILNKKRTEIDDLKNKINRLNNTLQTNRQEKDRIKNEKNNLQDRLNQTQTEQNDLQNQVNQLTNQINGLNQQLTDLTNERNDYQNKWDGADEKLGQKQEIIRDYLWKIEELEREKERLENDWQNRHQQELAQKDNEITRLKNQIIKVEEECNARPNITLEHLNQLERERNNIQTQRDNRPNITLNQWNNDFSKRPTQQQLNSIQQQKTNLQNELNRTRTELNNTKNERDNYRNWQNNHTCQETKVFVGCNCECCKECWICRKVGFIN
ncbi:MAG: hypothetical protein I3274_08160 [Candidatus Moeniiplasma glomeromycotorum]|nr:hypothetical protein [Candidatus Moeniiplasma glomeromycotorum]